MTDTPVRYVIEVDSKDAIKSTGEFNAANRGMADTAVASYSRAAKGSDSFAAQMIANNRNVIASNQQASLSHSLLADRIRVVGEAATTATAILVGGIKVLATYAASTQSASLTINGLVNAVRVAEVSYSAFTTGIASASTITTAATIGIAILAEETVRYTLHTAKLIEQRSLLSAQTGIDVKQINELALASQLAGKSNEFYLDSIKALQGGIGTSAGRSALGKLGIYGVDKESPELLSRIGVAFEKIQDPAQRASIGIALFGSEFERVQQNLNSRFGTSIELMREFGAALGPEQATNIDLAKRNLESLGRTLEGTFDPGRLNLQRLKNEIADLTASIINSPFSNPDAVQARKDHPNASTTHIGKYIEDAREYRIATELVTPVGQALIASRNAETIASNPFFVDAARQVADLREERSKTRESAEAFVTGAKERYSGALAALARDEKSRILGGHGTLTFTQRQAYNVEALEARKEVKFGQSEVAKFDAIKSAADAAAEAAKTVASAEKSAGEFRKHSLEEEFTGLGRVDIVERETLAQFGKSDAARRDIAIGVAALRERETRKLREEETGFLNADTLDRSTGFYRPNRLNRDAFEFSAKDFAFTDATAERKRLTGESAALFGVNEAVFARDSQLRALDRIDAQTVRQKQDLEQKKADIEEQFLIQSLTIRSAAIERANQKEISDYQQVKDAEGAVRGFLTKEGQFITPEAFGQRRDEIVRAGGEQGRQFTAETQALIDKGKEDARTKSDQIQREADLHQFESIKSTATGLIDTLFTHTRDFGQAVGNFFRHAVLAPLEEIASSQIARLIFGAINPGTSVSFASGGGGTGALGKYGGILGHFGFGAQPIFSKPSGGVFDILTGSAPSNRPVPSDVSILNGGYSGGIGGLFGTASTFATQLPALLGLNYAGDAGSPAEQIGAGRDTSGLPVLPSGLIDRTGTATPLNGPLVLGAATALGGAAGLSYGSAQAGTGIGGGVANYGIKSLLGNLANPTNLAGLFGFGANGVYGSGAYGTGITGALGSLASSPAAGAIGGLLFTDSLRRRPGVVSGVESTVGAAGVGASIGAQTSIGATGGAFLGAGVGLGVDGIRRGGFTGTLEDTAAGALIGFQVGGPVGAAVGFGVGIVRQTFFKSDREQIRTDVQSLYNLTISNQIADQLIQLAKSSYGGSYSVAIRSKPALDLLSLFAQSTGQNFLFSNVPRPAYITQQGGVLGQQAQYIGGQAYSFGGALGVVNNIPTATIPQYVAGQQTIRTNGQTYGGLPSSSSGNISLTLDAEATTAVLTGQTATYIAGNPRAVADANSQAQQGSYGLRTSAARFLSPGLIIGYGV